MFYTDGMVNAATLRGSDIQYKAKSLFDDEDIPDEDGNRLLLNSTHWPVLKVETLEADTL